MAFGSAAVPAGEVSALTDDKPVLIGLNSLYVGGGNDPEWGYGSGAEFQSIAANTDITASGYPVIRAFDGQHNQVTRPDDETDDQYWFKMDIGAATIDCFGIYGHNFYEINQTFDLTLTISNNADYSSPTILYNVTITAGEVANKLPIMVFLANRYTDCLYLQVGFDCAAANFTTVPQFGELWLGRRRQLSRNPIDPWDPRPWGYKGSHFVTEGGIHTTYKYSSGGISISPSWSPNPDDTKYSIDDVDQIQEWWKSIGYGSQHFLWTYEPSSNPRHTNVMYVMGGGGARLAMPFKGGGGPGRIYQPTFAEVAPFLQPLIG